MEIEQKTKAKILLQYLGRLAIDISKEEWATLKAEFPIFESVLVWASPKDLQRIGTYLLLAFGRKTYQFYYTYQLVDDFLGKGEEGDEKGTFYDLTTPVLVLMHTVSTMENRQLEALVAHTVEQRNLERRITIVLTEARLPKVEETFRLRELRTVSRVATFVPKKTVRDEI